jgi:ADP-ribose pyrophosphatase
VLEQSYLRKDVRVDRCELPNGNILEPLVLEFQSWITIVGLTPRREVLLIRQYRHGMRQVIWELPGGVVEARETPLAAARRELREETGFSAAELIEVGVISPNPANHDNRVYNFLAPDAERVGAQHLDDNEEIEVHPTPLDEALRMARRGELPNALHVSALFLALAHLNPDAYHVRPADTA